MLSGALSVAEGVLILLNPGYYDFDSALDSFVLFVEGAALVVLLGGLASLHVRQAGSYGRLGVAGFLAAFSGTSLAGAGHIAGLPFFDFVNVGGVVYVVFTLSSGFLPLWGVVYVAGIALMSAGTVALGIATMRARSLTVWSGPVLVGGLVGLWVAGNEGGWVLFGLAWLAVGYVMLPAKDATVR